jgi:ferredoxin
LNIIVVIKAYSDFSEMDLLDNVPQLHETSRLGCQIVLTKLDKPEIIVKVPSERNDARMS